MNFVLFSGSLRKDSLNKKLIRVAETLLSENHQVTVVDLQSLALPVYDGDIETVGMPEGVKKLGELIQKADGVVISSPEYNGSIAGSLKNTIDWVSRLRPVPLEGKPVLLMGASPGAFGSIRGLGFTRAPFEAIGSYLYPQMFALPKAAEAFSATGELMDEGMKKRLGVLLVSFASFSEKLGKK